MTVTRASFLAEYPEFDGADVAIVDAKIAAAQLRTPARIWGDLEDEGVSLLTAHMLAMSPYARELKLLNDAGETIYGKRRAELERTVSSGFRVTSSGTYL